MCKARKCFLLYCQHHRLNFAHLPNITSEYEGGLLLKGLPPSTRILLPCLDGRQCSLALSHAKFSTRCWRASRLIVEQEQRKKSRVQEGSPSEECFSPSTLMFIRASSIAFMPDEVDLQHQRMWRTNLFDCWRLLTDWMNPCYFTEIFNVLFTPTSRLGGPIQSRPFTLSALPSKPSKWDI